MGNKGILSVEMSGNKKIYTANVEKIATLAAFMQDFATNVLEMEQPLPVAMLAESKLIKKEELQELEGLLNQLAESNKNQGES